MWMLLVFPNPGLVTRRMLSDAVVGSNWPITARPSEKLEYAQGGKKQLSLHTRITWCSDLVELVGHLIGTYLECEYIGFSQVGP